MHKLNGAKRFLALILMLVTAATLCAQSTIDTGSLRGKVLDAKGNGLPGAIVRAKGPQGIKATETDTQGKYNLPFLTPGLYEITVSMDSYSTLVQNGVSVIAQQITGQSFKLSEGTETIIVKPGANVDTSSSTATTRVNLTDAVQAFAQDRSLTAAFDFAPGAIANSGVGGGNYSISGASGLENQYFIGGVNVTNSGYGAIGAYDSVRGASGTGITTEFLDNLDIREGGFEAEYGGALGGVISATILSGSNDFHTQLFSFYTPSSFSFFDGGRPELPYSTGGNVWSSGGNSSLEAGLVFSGPIVKDKLFFYFGYNPVWNEQFNRFVYNPNDIGRDKIVAPYANTDYSRGRNRVDNAVLHLTWQINEKHKLDFIAFGSPESRSGIIRDLGSRVSPSSDLGIPIQPIVATGVPISQANDGVMGSVRVKDISASLKYFGVWSPWMNVEATIAYHQNQVSETPGESAQGRRYSDQRRVDIYNTQTRNSITPIVSPSIFQFGGLGYYQGGTNDENKNYVLKITHNFHFGGEHELKYGVDYADLKYREDVLYTGGPLAGVDVNGGAADSFATLRTGVQATVRCFYMNPSSPTIPRACSTNPRLGITQFYRVYRGNFSPATPDTSNREMNLFIQDKWLIKNLTLNLGVRWSREKISNPSNYSLVSTGIPGSGTGAGLPLRGAGGDWVGTTDPDCVSNFHSTNPGLPLPARCYPGGPGKFLGTSYQFKGEFAPRIGLSWDVLGNGKSKLYTNFSRLFERVPNDLAVRSFGNEYGVTWLPFVNANLTNQLATARTTGAQPTRVAPGTRMPYKDDYILGYQFEIRPRWLLDIKASYRKQGRLLEDTQSAPVEAIQNYYYNSYLKTAYACMNCLPGQTELFPGAGYAKFGEYVLANVGDNAPTTFDQVFPRGTWKSYACPGETATSPAPQTAPFCDGFPTGVKTPVTFGKPKSDYKAVSFTLTRQPGPGQHLSVQASYRWSRLTGNYEGLFRNDNGQGDPNISSLFDFPDSPLLHTQYTMGRLNTDTPHSLKINTGWNDLFIKNLYGSVTFKWQSGQPRTPLLAHPVYQNAGEVPGLNPQYYLIDTRSAGYPGAFILKSYTPVERGSSGRNPSDSTWNIKLGYKWNMGKSALDLSLLVDNLLNDTHITKYDNFVENTTGAPNPDYGAPTGVKYPRTVRLGAKWSF